MEVFMYWYLVLIVVLIIVLAFVWTTSSWPKSKPSKPFGLPAVIKEQFQIPAEVVTDSWFQSQSTSLVETPSGTVLKMKINKNGRIVKIRYVFSGSEPATVEQIELEGSDRQYRLTFKNGAPKPMGTTAMLTTEEMNFVQLLLERVRAEVRKQQSK